MDLFRSTLLLVLSTPRNAVGICSEKNENVKIDYQIDIIIDYFVFQVQRQELEKLPPSLTATAKPVRH